MKKILTLFCVILAGTCAFAETLFVESNITLNNFWDKLGVKEEKIVHMGNYIIRANNLKRAPIVVKRTPSTINAFSNSYNKIVSISSGILPYIDNDDELAYILSHELSHSMEAYDGFVKIVAMNINSKKYEYKADLSGMDYMVKAGFNPIAGIIVANKIFEEPQFDWGIASSHPKGSKRMMAMYKRIYIKYPQYLNSEMTKNIVYVNFLNSQSHEIKKFEQQQKKRQLNQNGDI